MNLYFPARVKLFGYLLFVLSASPIYAQDVGRLVGTVTDDDSGESLPGVSVLLEETGWGTSSDLEGSLSYKPLNRGPMPYRPAS